MFIRLGREYVNWHFNARKEPERTGELQLYRKVESSALLEARARARVAGWNCGCSGCSGGLSPHFFSLALSLAFRASAARLHRSRIQLSDARTTRELARNETTERKGAARNERSGEGFELYNA